MSRAIALFIMMLVTPFSLTLAGDLDLEKYFDSLGSNKALLKRARMLDPENRVRIVQNRYVPRDLRLELGLNYGIVSGGDTYINTHNVGASLDFHINPHWSLGVRYYQSNNELTPQGQGVFEEEQKRRNQRLEGGNIFDVDYPLTTVLGVINWYPLYGKLNLFDQGISQFDVYLVAGGGQVVTENTSSPAYTFGGGLSIWISKHFSTRLEVRYQKHQDEVYDGARDIQSTIFTGSIGWIL
jgi:outer membrane beta-barrel protein